MIFFLFSVVAVALAFSVWSGPPDHYLAWISESDADILHRAGHGINPWGEQLRRLGIPAFPPYAWYRMSGYPGYHGRRRLQ